GVGRGDEVICPVYSFFATVEVVLRLGATPVFVDVLPASLSMDPAEVARRGAGRPRAVVPVHLFGACADMAPITAISREHRIPVVEDGAQALGANSGERRAGAFGTLGCFSFFPTKNLGGYGDGGLVATHDDGLALELRAIRSHGART